MNRFQKGLIYGAALTVSTTAKLMAWSQIECGSPWAAINPICHILDNDRRDYGDEFDLRDTSIGIASSASAMAAWGILYELGFGKVKWPKSLLSGAAGAAIAYAADYHLFPKRFTPGIEKKLSWTAIGMTYVAFAATLGVTAAILNRNSDT